MSGFRTVTELFTDRGTEVIGIFRQFGNGAQSLELDHLVADQFPQRKRVGSEDGLQSATRHRTGDDDTSAV